MIGKVKQWLGIEGVKLELVLPETVAANAGVIEGQLRFESLHPQQITEIKIALVEKYARGRGEKRLVDEYQLGAVTLRESIEVRPGEVIERPFRLPFTLVRSEIDEFGSRNILFGGLAKAARLAHNVKSTYRLEAEAKVKGVALNPFDRKDIVLK